MDLLLALDLQIVSEYERKRNAKAKQIAKYDENLAKQYTCQKLPTYVYQTIP